MEKTAENSGEKRQKAYLITIILRQHKEQNELSIDSYSVIKILLFVDRDADCWGNLGTLNLCTSTSFHCFYSACAISSSICRRWVRTGSLAFPISLAAGRSDTIRPETPFCQSTIHSCKTVNHLRL